MLFSFLCFGFCRSAPTPYIVCTGDHFEPAHPCLKSTGTIVVFDIEGTCCGKNGYVNIFITKMCVNLLD